MTQSIADLLLASEQLSSWAKSLETYSKHVEDDIHQLRERASIAERQCFEWTAWHQAHELFCSRLDPTERRNAELLNNLLSAAVEVLTNGEWTEGEQRGAWVPANGAREMLRDAVDAIDFSAPKKGAAYR